MLTAVEDAGVKTVVSFALRWNPLVVMLKELLARGAIGDVFCIEIYYLHFIGSFWGGYEDGRRKETGVSPFVIGGCHALDMVRFLPGPGTEGTASITEVFGWSGGWRKGPGREFDFRSFTEGEAAPLEFDGCKLALCKLEGGIDAKSATNFDCIMPYRFPITVYGSRGTWQWADVEHTWLDQKQKKVERTSAVYLRQQPADGVWRSRAGSASLRRGRRARNR